MRYLLSLVFLTWMCLGFGLLTSCGDDDDDNDEGDDDGNQEAFDSCDETATILTSIDEVSALLGISAADLLDTTGNGFTSTATYTEDTSILTQSPLGGETDLTVTISFTGGEIREIESIPVDSGSGQEIAVECPDRLEVEVIVNFSTADGAFNETWSAVLSQASSEDSGGLVDPTLTTDFDPAGVEGTFEIVSIAGVTPDSVTGGLSTLAVDPYTGSLDILVEQTQGEGDEGTVSQSRHIALSW